MKNALWPFCFSQITFYLLLSQQNVPGVSKVPHDTLDTNVSLHPSNELHRNKKEKKSVFLVLLPFFIKCGINRPSLVMSQRVRTPVLLKSCLFHPGSHLVVAHFPKHLEHKRGDRFVFLWEAWNKRSPKKKKKKISQGCCSRYEIVEPTKLPRCIVENYI